MKSLYHKMSVASIVLFITGMIVVAYFHYTTSDRIVAGLHLSDTEQVQLIRDTVNTTALFTGVEIAIGLVALLLLIYHQEITGTATRNSKAETAQSTEQKLDMTGQEKELQVQLQPVVALTGQTFPKPEIFFEKALSIACKELEASQAAVYIATTRDDKRVIRLVSGYALSLPESQTLIYEFGEGLAGQVAKEGTCINISNVPQGYITVLSGLGSASPNALVIVPVQFEGKVVGVLEVASFQKFSAGDENYLQALAGLLAERLSRHAEETALAWQE